MTLTNAVVAERAEPTVNLYAQPRANRYAEPGETKQISLQLFDRYVDVALRRAVPRKLEGEAADQWYADLEDFRGVWAQGASPKECLDALADVLREWLVLKIADADRDLPVIDDIDLTFLTYR